MFLLTGELRTGTARPGHTMSLSTAPACELTTLGGLLPPLQAWVPPCIWGGIHAHNTSLLSTEVKAHPEFSGEDFGSSKVAHDPSCRHYREANMVPHTWERALVNE